MAMLAEPRRKSKWTLNPRGKIWTNDETKLGQKLLEKMGWSKGKGLGRNEQGDLEPIRLNYKSDNKGMGYKGTGDEWVQHRDEFNALLSQLNGEESQEDKDLAVAANGLERRSKSSRARVHYQKFVRNKDLSKYSAEDLACILGKRQSKPTETPQQPEEPEQESESESSGEDVESHTHGVTTIKRGNIQEYFAAKMAALQQKNGTEENQVPVQDEKRRKSVTINEDMNLVKEFCSQRTIVEEFSNDSWAVEASVQLDQTETTKPKKKSKKKKKEDSEASEEAYEVSTAEENIAEEDCTTKKKKKRKRTEELETEVNDEEVSYEKKKKKKRKLAENSEVLTSDSVDETSVVTQIAEESESNVKKTKKKKKRKDTDSEETTSADPEDPITEKTSEREVGTSAPEETERKKKRKKEPKVEVSEQAAEPGPVETEPAEKKKKKKKKDKIKQEEQEEVVQNQNQEREQEATTQKEEPKTEERRNAVPLADSPAWGLPKGFKQKLKQADLEKFKGSNIIDIKGYGHC